MENSGLEKKSRGCSIIAAIRVISFASIMTNHMHHHIPKKKF